MSNITDRPESDQRTPIRETDITRRGFLRTAAGIGTLTGLSGCSSLSSRSMVTYPKLISGGQAVEWLSIPESWDQHRIATMEVYNRIRGWLQNLPGVVSTGLIRSERTFGGQNGFQIKITFASDADQSKVDIPATIDDIQTTTDRAPDWWGLADCSVNTDNCTNRDQSDRVGGGDTVGWVDGGYGTATCRVSVDDTPRLLHCGHVFWNDCTDATATDISGRTAVAWHEPVGTVESINVHGDYAVIDDQYGGEYTAIIDDNRTFPTMAGYVSEVACAYWSTHPRRNRPCLYNMGITTGLTTGTIIGTNVSYIRPLCITMEHAGVLTDCTAGQGDSGGPTFLLHNGSAYLVNVNSYYFFGIKSACNGARVGIESGGIAAWWIASNTNITFKSTVRPNQSPATPETSNTGNPG